MNDLEFQKWKEQGLKLLEELETHVEKAFEKVFQKRAEKEADKKAA